MVISSILILLPIIIIFTSIIVFILTKYKGFTEEDHLSEIKLVSPAFKLIKNIISKAFLSPEITLILLTMYTLSFTVACTSTFSYTSQVLDIGVGYNYNALLVKKGSVPFETISSILHNFIIVYQVFKGLVADNDIYYVLIIKCNIDNYRNRSELLQELSRFCKYLSFNYVIAHSDSNINETTILNMLKKPFNLVKVNLSRIANLELAPGVYFVHSVGTIGGLSLRIENIDKILLIPMLNNTLTILCPQECDTQTLVIGFDPIEQYQDNMSKILELFDYMILSAEGGVLVISKNLVPTVRTLLSMVLSFTISMIVIYAVGGGFIERIMNMYSNLYVLGITKNFFRSAVLLGMIITLFLTSIPLITISWIGYISSIALLNYFVSSTGFIVITSHRLRSASKGAYPELVSGYSYTIDIITPMDKLISCLKNMLAKDDFFVVNEIEGIKEERFDIIRVELIYRKALSTLASVEIYMDKIDNSARYNIVVDVWSLEDSSLQFLSSVQRLALSKISGGVISCIES